jgi:hypothetical protein
MKNKPSSTVEHKMNMTMDEFKRMSGLGTITDASYASTNGTEGPVSSIEAGVASVMPAGSYIDPTTGQFSQTPPPPPVPVSTGSNYTIYIIVAGVLVALYFYQKHKGRSMLDLSGLAKDFTKKTRHVVSESEDEL